MISAESNSDMMTVTVKRTFKASAERVFDAWLDPERARHFLFTHPGSQEIVRAEIDARVGGQYLFVARRNGKDSDHFGEYLEIERPRRLVFTLSVPTAWADISRIQIDVAPLESGCELTLTHQGVLARLAADVEEGWTSFLNLLPFQAVEENSQAVAK
jgi:uncharacterized protein YndB with AHSA1/START domain